MRRWLGIVAVMAGCSTPDASVAPGGYLPDDLDDAPSTDAPADPVDTETTCSAELVWVEPEHDAHYVAVTAAITAGFSEPLPLDQTAWSVQVDGVAGTVDVSADRRTVTFTPDEPLAFEATYAVSVTVCDVTDAVTFETVGPPIPLQSLLDHTWSADLSDLQWLAPLSSGLWVTQLDLPDAVFSIVLDDGTPRLAARFAARIDGLLVPIPCAPVIDLGELDLSMSPRFATRPTDIRFPWAGRDVSIGAVRIEGTFTDDGRSVEAIQFDGTIDMRLVEDMLGLPGLCFAAAEVGDQCVACDDGDASCLRALATYDGASDIGVLDIFDDLLARLGLCDVP